MPGLGGMQSRHGCGMETITMWQCIASRSCKSLFALIPMSLRFCATA